MTRKVCAPWCKQVPLLTLMWSLTGIGTVFAEVVFETQIPRYPSTIVLDVRMGDTDRKAMLDTGATLSVVDESLRAEVGAFQKLVPFTHLGGESRTAIHDAPRMELGPLQLPVRSVILINLALPKMVTGLDTSVVIGLDAIDNHCLEVNYDAGQLRLTKDLPLIGSDWKSITVKKERLELATRIFLQSSLNEIPIDLGLDLGSNMEIQLSDENFSKLKEAGWIAEEERLKALSVVGGFKARSGTFTQGNLLGVDLNGVAVSGSGTGNRVGRNFLFNLNFKLDLQSDRFFYQKNKVKTVPNIPKQMSMALMFLDGMTVVAATKPDGKAEKAGFQKGDVIKKFGSLPAEKLNEVVLYQLCGEKKGQVVQMEVSRFGENFKFVLAL